MNKHVLIWILILFLVLFQFPYPSVWANPDVEDYTTYTEVDPNTDITVTANKLTIATMRRDVSAYVYDDKGVGYFSGDFTHLVEAKATGATNQGGLILWALANTVNDENDAKTAGDLITVQFYDHPTSGISIWLREWYSGSNYDDKTYLVSLNIWYYLTIERASNVLTVEIYTDSARTSLVDVLTRTLNTVDSYRYIYGVMSLTSAFTPAATLSCEIRNLELDITPPTFNLLGLNSTLNASGIQFTINLSDNVILDTCFLEWNNSGTLTNVSMSISGSTYLCLFNQTLNATEGVRVDYRFFFNDTSNNWNQTVQHFLFTNTKPVVVVVTVNIPVLFVGSFLLLGCCGFLVFWAKRKK